MPNQHAVNNIVLAALRHLERQAHSGTDLGYLSDIVDPSLLHSNTVGMIGDSLNFGNMSIHQGASKNIETYQAVALSTAHLSSNDVRYLETLASGDSMVMERATGFFIKLYGTSIPQVSNEDPHYSGALNSIIRWAESQGFQMIEFDCDAAACDQFIVFDHDQEVA